MNPTSDEAETSTFNKIYDFSDTGRVDSLLGMLDLHLLIWTCLTGSVLLFLNNMFIFIYTLYQTEVFINACFETYVLEDTYEEYNRSIHI